MLIKTISILLILITVTFFNACSSDSLNKTLKCSDLAVINTLSKILSTNSRKATINIDMVRKKIDLTEQNGMRTCRTSVDYVYSVDEDASLIGQDIDGVSKNNQVFYTVVLSETGKHIVSIVKQ